MKSVKLEILTPHSMFFSGEVESLTVETPDGSEGYLHGHIWCRKLLKENSKVSILMSLALSHHLATFSVLIFSNKGISI